jgi:hypothetical protein
MAKLFYTLEEAAQKLRKSPEEVLAMAKSGQLQELRDKDQVLFRRSAIDQIAPQDDGGELNLDDFDASSSASDIRLGGSSMGGDDLKLDDDLQLGGDDLKLGDDDLKLDDGPGLGLADDLKLDDGPIAPSIPAASASGIDLGGDDDLSIGLADSGAGAPAKPAAPAPAPAAAARANPSPAASASGIGGSAMGLGDSNADSMMMDAPGASGARRASADDSMAAGNTQLEAVGSGSGLLDISSDESFFGAQMIEESMGGEDAAALPADAGDIFGGGEAAATEEAAPVTVGTTGATFGAATLAEAFDPKFSGFAAGAMLACLILLGGVAWMLAETVIAGQSDVSRMVAENWMIVLGGGAGAVLLFGGVGFGIGKATA